MTEETPPKVITFYVISDSAGETASKLSSAIMAQFPGVEFELYRRVFIRTTSALLKTLTEAKKRNAIVLHTLIIDELVDLMNQFCEQSHLIHFDLLTPLIREVSKRSGFEPSKEPGALHHLDDNYFKRIKAIEFAVKYDDGKDPRGFLEADIVLLGISRTSKTPLSQFLGNKGLKVANLPVIPQAHIPKQIWEIDPKKIVGLTNDLDVLIRFRRERMIAYGLDPDTAYSDLDKIKEELSFADELYDKIGCLKINVASRSIEETASLIMDKLNLEDHSYFVTTIDEN